MTGYVRIYRSLMLKGYYTDSEYVHLWVHLIMKATYQEKEYLFNGKIEHLQPGQFISGLHSLSRETGIHRSKIDRILRVFEIEKQIEQSMTNKFRIISICNWSEHQEDEKQTRSKREASEKQVRTNNKDKKDKKDIYSDFVLPKDIDPEVWNAFVDLRTSLKKPLTPYAKRLIVEKLDKMGQPKNLVLQKSIAHGWQGVFPLNDDELPREPEQLKPTGTRYYQNREGKWVNMATNEVFDAIPQREEPGMQEATNSLITNIARKM